MRIIALLLVAFVALSHVGFLILEMFYWNEPVGREIFNTTPEFWLGLQQDVDLWKASTAGEADYRKIKPLRTKVA